MGLDDRLKPLVQRPFRTEPVPGSRGGVESFNVGENEGGGTMETVIRATATGSRKLNPQELGLVKPFVIPSGVTLDDMTGFEYHGVRVDNHTPQWMRIHGILDHFVPPHTFGFQIPVMAGTSKAWVTWEAPVGYTQPGAGAAGVTALIYFTEAYLYPTPGIDVSALVAGGVDQKVNIDQVGGTAVQAGPAGRGDLSVELADSTGANLGRIFPLTDGQTIGATNGLLVNAIPALTDPSNNANRGRAMGSGGDGLGVALVSQPSATGQRATGNNVAAVITFGSVAGQRNRVLSIDGGYSAVAATTVTPTITTTDGTLTLVSGVGTAIGAGRSIALPEGGIKFAVATAVTVTLAASGAVGSIGDVNAAALTT